MPDEPTYYNPDTDSVFDPEGYEAYWRTKLESEYDPFSGVLGDYTTQAQEEIDPLYQSVYDQLSSMETQQRADTSDTYDDLLVNLQEGYNQRGTFFSGEAMVGEADLGKERGRAMTNIGSYFATQKSATALDQQTKIQDRAETLQTNAYNDYLSTRTNAINTKLFDAMKEFYPHYQERLQQQLDDENALWIDIPIEPEALEAEVVTDAVEAPPTGQPRNQAEEQKRLGDFGALYGRNPSSQADWNFVQIATYGYDGERNQDSERKALQIFQDKFGRNPDFSNNVDENIIHAIAYSGASK